MFVVKWGGVRWGGGGLKLWIVVNRPYRGLHTKSWPPDMPRTLPKVLVVVVVEGGGLGSEFSVHV